MVEGVPEPPPMERVPGIWIFSLETQIRDFKIHLGLCNIGIHLNTFQPILCNINITFLLSLYFSINFCTGINSSFHTWKDSVVGDYINIMKTTFDFNLNLNRAIKQHGIHIEVKRSYQFKNPLFDYL